MEYMYSISTAQVQVTTPRISRADQVINRVLLFAIGWFAACITLVLI